MLQLCVGICLQNNDLLLQFTVSVIDKTYSRLILLPNDALIRLLKAYKMLNEIGLGLGIQ